MSTRSIRTPWSAAVVLGAALAVCLAAEARAACDVQSADAYEVASARLAIATECPCDGAPSQAAYVACAKDVVALRVLQSILPASCRQTVLACARRSTCGRPDAVACLRTRTGSTRCTIERDAASCTAPRDGTARVGDQMESCCDSEPSGCPPTPIPSPTPTPAPTELPLCSPPPCPTPGHGFCEGCRLIYPLESCPNSCGMICVTPTPVAP